MPRDRTTHDVEAKTIMHDMTKLLASNLYLCVCATGPSIFEVERCSEIGI